MAWLPVRAALQTKVVGLGAFVAAIAGDLLVEAHTEERDVRSHDEIYLVKPTFEPSASEWIERARPHIRGDPPRARQILDDLRREMPEDGASDVGDAILAVGGGDALTALARRAARVRGSVDRRSAQIRSRSRRCCRDHTDA